MAIRPILGTNHDIIWHPFVKIVNPYHYQHQQTESSGLSLDELGSAHRCLSHHFIDVVKGAGRNLRQNPVPQTILRQVPCWLFCSALFCCSFEQLTNNWGVQTRSMFISRIHRSFTHRQGRAVSCQLDWQLKPRQQRFLTPKMERQQCW